MDNEQRILEELVKAKENIKHPVIEPLNRIHKTQTLLSLKHSAEPLPEGYIEEEEEIGEGEVEGKEVEEIGEGEVEGEELVKNDESIATRKSKYNAKLKNWFNSPDFDKTYGPKTIHNQIILGKSLIPYSKKNKGYKYILSVIDCFTKYAWAIPLKSKTAKEVTNAMSTILINRSPQLLQLDNGKEFYNSIFDTLMKKEFTVRGNHNWLSILSALINEYNNTRHRTIGMTPTEADYKPTLVRMKHKNMSDKRNKFKVGDSVRVSTHKEDYTGNPIAGCFYVEEINKTEFTNTYLIEKVIRIKGQKVFVKWLGFDNSHNTTRESEKNILFSELVVSNKSIQNELTSCNQQTDKHEIDIKSLNKKLENLINQVSLITTTVDDIQQFICKLSGVLGSISDLESRIRNIEVFTAPPPQYATEYTESMKKKIEKTITKSIPNDTRNNDLEYHRKENYGE
ncbi:Ribonuclease H-like domain,Integrase, catalytic core,Chromo/chromo shadow domain [Cinara cedri]|uniref:Ribonuclease H-like domain,Integrase, catalytic core,Chromo/chromo shadow domain n=1 Tax=Cinara cedri TaxID=506608 RepID=A0A5E4MF48_9HEMI|nr:Ribonuclease H-like domain,Integrase, catalytic core,Chromo/chromo shadow domain [Cinara cedri]